MRMAISLRLSARSFFIRTHAILAKLELPVILYSLALAAAQPVSYSRQIAPILAMRCHGCHGSTAAGGLDTRTHAGLTKGGNLGPGIVPGEPDRSTVVEFIEGRRGEKRRMPLAESPLSMAQIALIRRWIEEGAREDEDRSPKYLLTLPGVAMERGRRLEIQCRVPVLAYVRLDVKGGAPLHSEEAAIRRAGDTITWSVGAGPDWPSSVDLDLTILYAEREPSGAVLSAPGRETSGIRMIKPPI